MRRRLFSLGFLALLSVAGVASAREAVVVTAFRAEPLPEIDGDVLDDPAWQEHAGTTGFVQVRPFAGEEASERTEVWVSYSDEALYIATVCYDREPDAIIVSDSRRDASLADTDSFQVILDTFLDEQNGFVFGTNPAGIEYDGQVASEGQGGGGGGRFLGGSGGGFNLNWDGVWEVATSIGDYGWSAEMAIPFTTLRYPSEDAQVWGINFQRNIRRRNETAYWAPLDQQWNLYRLSEAGRLESVQAPPRRNLKLVPYALFQGREGGASSETESDTDVGIDLKYGLTPGLTLDATLNTDFAQVEVDEQQVNLDRFNLFFPEKRPFFLENAGLFSVGSPGQIDLFFSRRIGIGETGQPIPILGGLRVSGKVKRTNVGLLAMETDASGDEPANRFGVARIRRELPNRSNVGVLFVDRDSVGPQASDRRNQTYAVDGQLGLGTKSTFSGFLAATETPGLEGRDHAFELGYNYASAEWRASLEVAEVAENFNPEVGFLARSAYRKASALLFRYVRPKDLMGFHELRPHASYTAYWDFDGFMESGRLHVDNHWEWRSGYEFHTGVNFTREGVKEPFEISPGVVVQPGTYRHEEAQLFFRSNTGAPVSATLRATLGGFFGGDRVSLDATLLARRGEALSSELEWSHNEVRLPVGDFDLNLGRLRVSYSFSTKLLLQALVQYNDRTDDVSTNLRLGWLRRANTGLFLVYNEIREFGGLAVADPDRSLILKYSHLVDIFR